jgi:fluoroquinolone resistance protein
MIKNGQPLDVMIYVDHAQYLQKKTLTPIPIETINPLITHINVMNRNYQLDTYVMNNVHIDGRTYDDNAGVIDDNDEAIIISLTATNCVFTNCVFIIETFHQYIVNFNGSFFENCIFEGHFDRSDFGNTILNNCTFNDLTPINQTRLNFCNFEKSIIENSILVNILGEIIDFTGAKFHNVDLENSILQGSTFKDVIFKKMNMKGTDTNLVRKVNNRNKTIKYATKFINTIFDHVNMQESTLESTKLINVKMTKVDLYGSIMTNTNLEGAILNDVDLTDVTLDDAILKNTTMTNVNFTNTSLWNFDPIRDSNIPPNLEKTNIDNDTCYFMKKSGDDDSDSDSDDDAPDEKIIFSHINRNEARKLMKTNIMNESFKYYFDDLLKDIEKHNIEAARMSALFSKKIEKPNLLKLPENYLLDFNVPFQPSRRERIIEEIRNNEKKIEKIERGRIKKRTGDEVVSKSYNRDSLKYKRTGGKNKRTCGKTTKTGGKTTKTGGKTTKTGGKNKRTRKTKQKNDKI